MAKVRRANVVLEVKDDQLERFVDMGYDVIDDAGNVIQKSVPTDIGTLTKAYMEHEAEIEKLKAELAELKAKPKKTTKPKEAEVVEDEPQLEAKPKTTKSTKKK